jgi:hypothetical protein
MSSKETYIQSIRRARTHQIKWANQIKLMVSGVGMDKEKISPNQSESDFGKWLYEEAMIFSTTNARGVIDEMTDLHTQCYDIYLKIYGALFANQKSGIMGMFGTKKASANDLQLAQNYYEELIDISDKLLSALRRFESMMLAMPETKYDEMITVPEPVTTAEAEAASRPKQKIYFRGRVIEE